MPIAILVATVLFFSPWSIVHFNAPKALLFAVLVQAWAIVRLWQRARGRQYKSNVPAVWGKFLLVLVIALAASTTTSISPFTSFFGSLEHGLGLLTWLHLLLFAYLCATSVVREYVFAWVATALIALTALYGIAQRNGFDLSGFQKGFSLYEDTTIHRAFATFGHPNLFAAFLVTAMPMVCFLVLRARRWRRGLAVAVLVLGLIALVYTYSRAGYIAFTCALIILAMAIAWRRLSRDSLKTAGALAVVAAGFWILVFAFGVPERTTGISAGVPSGRIRLAEWSYAWAHIRARPLTGYGLENYRLLSFRRPLLAVEVRDGVADRVHNFILDYAIVGGAPLAALMLVPPFAVAWFVLRRRLSLFGMCAAAALSGYYSFMLLNYESISSIPLAIVLFVFILGDAYQSAPAASPAPRTSAPYLAIIGLAAFIAFFTLNFIGQMYARAGEFAYYRGEPAAVPYLNTAVRLSPTEPHFLMLRALAKKSAGDEAGFAVDRAGAYRLGLPLFVETWYLPR